MDTQEIVFCALAICMLAFLVIRRRVIVGLQEEIAALGSQLHKLGQVAEGQRRELDRMMEVATQERRARQMATLGSQPAPKAPPAPSATISPQTINRFQRKQEEATRREHGQTNVWEPRTVDAGIVMSQASAPEPAYRGGGGTFDGGGASGDYGRSESCSSTSSSSDSGSSSSSDSGSSCGSGD